MQLDIQSEHNYINKWYFKHQLRVSATNWPLILNEISSPPPPPDYTKYII